MKVLGLDHKAYVLGLGMKVKSVSLVSEACPCYHPTILMPVIAKYKRIAL